MRLFDLTSAFQNLLELAAEGEDFEAALDELRGDIEEKAENYAKVIKSLEAEAAAISEEAKKLQAKAQHRTNAVDRLKAHLMAGLEAADIDKVTGELYTVALQNSSPSVEVEDWSQLPDAYVFGTVKLPWQEITDMGFTATSEEPTIDRRAILDDYKATGIVPAGATIKQGRHIRIR